MEYKIGTGMTRFSYIYRISKDCFGANDDLLPSASQQQSYDEALGHLVCLFSNQKDGDSVPSFHGNSCSRKEGLRKILNLLRRMERDRLYDPPADDEIKYYILIKKYMRSILTFVSARQGSFDGVRDGGYKCFSNFRMLHHAEELAELNGYLSDFAQFVAKMDVNDGSPIKPLMGIQDNYEVTPLINGSKERSNAFYWHKFVLAFFDIRSSELVHFPPDAQEERSYQQVLDHVSLLVSCADQKRSKGDEVNVYSSELYVLFLEKMDREARDVERHCKRVTSFILKKLPMLEECWESLESLSEECDFYAYSGDDDSLNVKVRSKLAEKCPVSVEELPQYIARVDRCRDIAQSLFLLTCECYSNDVDRPTQREYGKLHSSVKRVKREFGWDALHVLTLIKTGCFSSGNVFREQVVLRNPEKNGDHVLCPSSARLQCETEMKKRKRAAQEEDEGENVKNLRAIIDDLRQIGDSNMKTDEEENDLMYRIWLSVASSVHFFVSAMAYEQQRYVVAHGGLADVRKIGLRTSTRKRMMKDNSDGAQIEDYCRTKSRDHVDMTNCLIDEPQLLSKILKAYSRILNEKLESWQLFIKASKNCSQGLLERS